MFLGQCTVFIQKKSPSFPGLYLFEQLENSRKEQHCF